MANIFYTLPYTSGYSLYFSATRLVDGLNYDFNDNTFKTTPTTATSAMSEGTSPYTGRYNFTVTSPSGAQWTDGWYEFRAHNGAAGPVLALGYPYIEGLNVAVPPWGSKGQGAQLDFTQAISATTSRTFGAVAWAIYSIVFGQRYKDRSAQTITLKDPDGATVAVKHYDSLNTPTTMT